MNEQQPTPTLLKWINRLAIVCFVLLPLSILGVRLSILNPGLGLLGTGLACLGALLLLILSGITFFIPRYQSHRKLITKTLILVMFPTLVTTSFLIDRTGRDVKVPPIHNISTDLENPPQFVKAQELRGSSSNPLDQNKRTIKLQKKGYPHLKPLVTTMAPMLAFQRAINIADQLGWEVYHQDPETGMIEAVDTTAIFGFKDDIAIRVDHRNGSTVIDLHSVSRFGGGDIGANAARIDAFIEAFQAN